jgi:hypothetical protein
MDHWIENLTQWAQWTLQRSGRHLFLIGVSFFLLGLAGWLIQVFRRWIGRRRDLSAANLAAASPKALARRILEISACPSVILMTSEQYDCLSVTVPVQTAMELVRHRKRCLLIDLDLPRNPVARVFELESLPDLDRPRPIQTPFKDLHVWPAVYFNGEQSIPLGKVAAAAGGAYDVILIYAPLLQESPHLQPAAAACQCALLFHPANDFSQGLRLALQQCGAVIFDVPSNTPTVTPPPNPPASKKKIVEWGVPGHNEAAIRDSATVGDTDKLN